MNKDELQDLISDIELLYKYSEFIPTSYKSSYNQNLNNIKLKLSGIEVAKKDEKNTIFEVTKDTLKNEYRNIRTFVSEEIYKEIFYDVIDSIVPYIENSKKSLKDLFLVQDKPFLDFIEYYQAIYEKDNKVFKKNKSDIANRGWIKIGEILINSGIINSDMLKEALEYQTKRGDLFIGESLIELLTIKEVDLRKALKCQRWLFKLCERSEQINLD